MERKLKKKQRIKGNKFRRQSVYKEETKIFYQ